MYSVYIPDPLGPTSKTGHFNAIQCAIVSSALPNLPSIPTIGRADVNTPLKVVLGFKSMELNTCSEVSGKLRLIHCGNTFTGICAAPMNAIVACRIVLSSVTETVVSF